MQYFSFFPKLRDHHQNVWLISVPTGRFVANASLSLQKTFVADASPSLQKTLLLTLRFRTEQSFLGRPISRFAAGSRANRCFLRESVSAT